MRAFARTNHFVSKWKYRSSKVKWKAHKKYGDPSETDVIERDCSLEWIIALALALRIVIVPINAGLIVDERDVAVWHGGTVAH